MNYREKIIEIDKLIKSNRNLEAKKELENIIAVEEFKVPEDEQATHYSFYNYIEAAIYFNKYRPQKKNIDPNNNIAEVYFFLGYIEYENKNYEKAIEYLDKGLEWNPVSIQIMSEKINVYRGMGDWEKYRVEIEKAYEYIYEVPLMAKYYRDLGFYYTEKGLYDVSNALYSYSRYFVDDELVSNELMYIAQQEHREPRISTMEEIEFLFKKYNIPQGISNNIVQIIYGEYQNLLKNNPDLPVTKYLARVLYDITKDKQFMLYVPTHDDITGINLMMPENWKALDKNKYNELGVSSNTTFLFLNEYNQLISIVCDGKCSKDELDAAYKKNVETMKKQGIEIIEEFSIEGQKNIKQVFVDSCKNDMKVRILQNYLVLNGYLFNISWEVENNVNPNEILKKINNGLEMELVWSLTENNEENKNNYQAKSKNDVSGIIFDYFSNDVSEIEIRKIIEHYKKIEKNEKEYVKSFANLARQYDEVQLKIICKYLPLSVRTVLEKKSPIYQKLEIEPITGCHIHTTVEKNGEKQEISNKETKEINIKNNDNSVIRFVVPNCFEEIIYDSLPDDFVEETLDDLFLGVPGPAKQLDLFTDKKYELRIFIEKITKDRTLEIIIEELLKYSEVLEKGNNKFIVKTMAKYGVYNGRIRGTKFIEEIHVYRYVIIDNYIVIIKNKFAQKISNEERIINSLEEIDAIIDNIFEKIQYIPSNKPETNNEVNKPIKIKCPSCNVDFELKWNVPSTEKVFYCKCPNCNAEIKHKNPNYKEI